MQEVGYTDLNKLGERATLITEETEDSCGVRLYSDGRHFWVACVETGEVEAHATTVDAAAAAMAGSLSAYRNVRGDDDKPLYPELVKAAKRWEKPNRADLVTDALADHDLPDYALTAKEVEEKEKDRGSRWFVSGAVSPGRYRYAYAETRDEADQTATRMFRDGLAQITITPPAPIVEMDAALRAAAEERAEHQRAGREMEERHAALVARAAREHPEAYEETRLARLVERDRGKVREWLGKPRRRPVARHPKSE